MSQASNYLEVEIRKHLLRTGSWTKPSALYVALCTAAPTDASTGSTITEPSGNGYARQQLDPLDANWSAPDSTGGASLNLSALTFTASGGNWGTITHWALCDASSAGNMLVYGTLTASKIVNDGESFVFEIGTITITVA